MVGPSKRGSRHVECKPGPRRVSLAEREEISRWLSVGESLRSIAGRLSRAPSTVSREVTANGGRAHYRGVRAHTIVPMNVPDDRNAPSSWPDRCW